MRMVSASRTVTCSTNLRVMASSYAANFVSRCSANFRRLFVRAARPACRSSACRSVPSWCRMLSRSSAIFLSRVFNSLFSIFSGSASACSISTACSAVKAVSRWRRARGSTSPLSCPCWTRLAMSRNSSVISCPVWSRPLMASRMARCSLSSSSVGEVWQYFVPNSSRETHRQTIRFLPFLAQVHRL